MQGGRQCLKIVGNLIKNSREDFKFRVHDLAANCQRIVLSLGDSPLTAHALGEIGRNFTFPQTISSIERLYRNLKLSLHDHSTNQLQTYYCSTLVFTNVLLALKHYPPPCVKI